MDIIHSCMYGPMYMYWYNVTVYNIYVAIIWRMAEESCLPAVTEKCILIIVTINKTKSLEINLN